MTSKGSRSKKRRGRPGVAPVRAKATPKAGGPRAAEGSSAVGPATSETAAKVKPDRQPSQNDWGIPGWLMLASTAWSAVVVWQLVATSGEPAATGDGIPWALVLAALVAGVASGAAFWLMRQGSPQRARPLLIVTAVFGVFGIFSTVAAVVSMWLVRWRRR